MIQTFNQTASRFLVRIYYPYINNVIIYVPFPIQLLCAVAEHNGSLMYS